MMTVTMRREMEAGEEGKGRSKWILAVGKRENELCE